MPLTMKILGWNVKGLRCPDHKIDLTNDDESPYPVSLIQMPNGTGKTTTLNLIRAALSGKAEDWSSEEIVALRKQEKDIQFGRFRLSLLLGDTRATIVMEFNFKERNVKYSLTYGSGKKVGFEPPQPYNQFMASDFVNFYVFDGELAEDLLNSEKTEAARVVNSLFHMIVFTAINRKIEEYWSNYYSKLSHKAHTKKGFRQRQNKVKDLKTRFERLKQKQIYLQNEESNLTVQISNNRNAYDQKIRENSQLQEKRSEAKAEVLKHESTLQVQARNVLEKMRKPHALSSVFADSLLSLKEGLDRLKLPENAAKEFFLDLAQADECVCGRKIDKEIASVILERAERYLGSEDVSLLASMKREIKNSIGNNPDSERLELEEQLNDLRKVANKNQQARTHLDYIELIAGASNPDIEKAKTDIDELDGQLEILKRKLERFDSADDSRDDNNTFGIKVIQTRLEKAEKQFDQIRETINLKQKRDKLLKIMKSAKNIAQEKINTELCKEANERIGMLMPNNDLQISTIEKCLVLENQEGASVGETLSVAYAFLSTLFCRSEHELPFVVDSPAGSIDLAVRSRVGKLIPHLSNQFIAFTISSERSGFIRSLREEITNSSIQYITLFRKDAIELEVDYKNNFEFLESTDGFQFIGENFFNKFQDK